MQTPTSVSDSFGLKAELAWMNPRFSTSFYLLVLDQSKDVKQTQAL